jgi:hypothetical protein
MDFGQHGADRVEIQVNGVLGRKRAKNAPGRPFLQKETEGTKMGNVFLKTF